MARVNIVVTNIGQNAYLLRNDGASRNGWIKLELTGHRSNRDGIGCLVKVVSASGLTQYFTVTTAAGYLSASDKRLLIGLGADRVAKCIEVTWPSGFVQSFENIPSGKILRVLEPAR